VDYLGRKTVSGQSAIEYLMTYGWMLLVVAIVGGTIYSTIGSQNLESIQGFDSNKIQVTDFGASNENNLMFSMSDTVGQTEVSEVIVSNSDSSNITYILNQDISEEKLVNLPGIKPSDETNDLEIEIVYDSGSLNNLSSLGHITGFVEIDDTYANKTMLLDGLVGYWPLSERYSDGNTAYDLTRYNNHGELVNSPGWTEGHVGEQAAEFEGEDEAIDVNDNSAISMTESLTISMWFYLDDTTSNNGKPSHYLYKSDAYGIFNDGPSVTKDNDRNYVNSDDPPTDRWVHTAAVYDGTELVEYRDGTQIASTTVDAPIDDSQNLLRIGNAGGYNWTVDGAIDDVRIYNRELSKDEISVLYNMGS